MHPGGISPSATSSTDRQPRIVGAIPARYGSERLPGKALATIAGRPLIEHVYRRAADAPGLERVVVLTDDERIADAVEAFGGTAQMTPTDCASGTDRIAWAARDWEVEAIVNIQGDEPLLDPAAIGAVAEHLARHPDDPVVTLAAPAEPSDAGDPDVVKVVLDRRGYALYFSRAPIPYERGPVATAGAGEGTREGASVLRHQGIYGYQRRALLAIAALEPSDR